MWIAYYRVSTSKQVVDSQRNAVRQMYGRPTREFVEIESGRVSDRPILREAIDACKATKATLVVAKLDRLARSVAFTAALLDSDIDFVCCDNPNATRLTIHILAAVAEDESRRIGQRTKAGMAARKATGSVFGLAIDPSRAVLMSRKSAASRRRASNLFYAPLRAYIGSLRELGLSPSQIASRLNDEGRRTIRGCPFRRVTVARLLKCGSPAPP